MALIPESENTIRNKIDKQIESCKQKPRLHFGMSQAGHKCDRWLWLKFHWAIQEQFSGRMLRLFRRGQREEDVVVNDLKSIGCVIENTGYNQRSVYFGSHCKGSLDGVIKRGVPGARSTEHILEIKTHSDKSFKELEKNGVQKSKPMHYVQMQVYMYGSRIKRALYIAVNKNDDTYYTERVRLDREFAKKYVERAKRIALAPNIPEPMSTDPAWFECKFCPAHEFCFKNKNVTEVNCRTCAHSTPLENSTWFCEKWKATIPDDAQYAGCDSHVFHPELVPSWELVKEKSTDWAACYRINGQEVVNGESGYKSTELLLGVLNDPAVDNVRKVFDGEIVEVKEAAEIKEEGERQVPLF
jgi:hypothetical protein